MLVPNRSLFFFLLLTTLISIGSAAGVLAPRVEAKQLATARHVFAGQPARSSNSLESLRVTAGANGYVAKTESRFGGRSEIFDTLYPGFSRSGFKFSSILVGRIVRVVDTNLQAGQNGTVTVQIDSQGDENAMGFSLNFDQTKMTYVSAVRGADAVTAGATMNVNPSQVANGKLGVAIALPAGASLPAGTRELLIVTFSVSSAASGNTTVSFGDSPIGREIVDANVFELTGTYQQGSISITGLPSPVPVLSSVNPNPVTAGSGAFPLTANGSNFVATSVVRVNGSDRPTTFVSANQLTAQLTAADTQSSGTVSITVFNPAPGGGLSGAVNLTVNNPVPVLSSISPTNTVAGSAGFTLTANGSSFVSGSVIRWNGSARTTTFVNANQLTAQIPASDVTTAGTAIISIFNPTPGGGTSNTLNFVINTNPALRIVRVVGTTLIAGQNGTVSVEIDAQGDENAFGFSLHYDPTKLSYVSAALGSGAVGATLNLNTSETALGHVGVALANSAGVVFPPGTRQLLVVTFSVPLPVSGTTPISFGDTPIPREVVDGNAGSLTATFTPGNININHRCLAHSVRCHQLRPQPAELRLRLQLTERNSSPNQSLE
jgi:hypothetical protein